MLPYVAMWLYALQSTFFFFIWNQGFLCAHTGHAINGVCPHLGTTVYILAKVFVKSEMQTAWVLKLFSLVRRLICGPCSSQAKFWETDDTQGGSLRVWTIA